MSCPLRRPAGRRRPPSACARAARRRARVVRGSRRTRGRSDAPSEAVAGEVPCAIELRSKDDVQPCWLKLGEMKRISFGQRRRRPAASPRSISSTRDGSRPKVFISISAVPTPAAPAPTTITSSVAAVADAPAPRYLCAGIRLRSSVRSFLREARPSATSLRTGRAWTRAGGSANLVEQLDARHNAGGYQLGQCWVQQRLAARQRRARDVWQIFKSTIRLRCAGVVL